LGAGEGGVSPSRDLLKVMKRFTMSLHWLPVGNFVPLGRALVATHCLLWFVLFNAGLLYWILNPEELSKAKGAVKIVTEEEAADMKRKALALEEFKAGAANNADAKLEAKTTRTDIKQLEGEVGEEASSTAKEQQPGTLSTTDSTAAKVVENKKTK
jgi:hypothetical protein